jgi:hypothetical protein
VVVALRPRRPREARMIRPGVLSVQAYLCGVRLCALRGGCLDAERQVRHSFFSSKRSKHSHYLSFQCSIYLAPCTSSITTIIPPLSPLVSLLVNCQLKLDHPGEARMTCGRSPHHGSAMTWSRSDHHPGEARMTCGRSPHHGFAMTSELRSDHDGFAIMASLGSS